MRRAMIVVIGLALALRLAAFGVVACCPARYFDNDTRGYLIPAYHLGAAYMEPASTAFRYGLMRIVGYPVFIAGVLAVHRSLLLVLLAQVVIGVAVVVLLLWQRVWLGDRGAVVAGALLAVDIVSIVYTNQLLSESLFAALIAASIFLLLDAIRRDGVWRFVLVGLISSFASLTRPIGLYLPLVLVPVVAVLLRAKRWRALVLSGALLVAYLIPVGGWMLHVHQETGTWVFSTIEGLNVLNYRAAGAIAEETGVGRREAARRLDQQLTQLRGRSSNPARESLMEQSYGIQVLRQHPVGAVKSAMRGIAATVFGRAAKASRRLFGARSARWWLLPLEAAALAMGVIQWLGGVAGVWAFVKERQWAAAAVPGVTIAYLVVFAAGPEASSRFRTAVIPLLCFLAGKGLPVSIEQLRGRFGRCP